MHVPVYIKSKIRILFGRELNDVDSSQTMAPAYGAGHGRGGPRLRGLSGGARLRAELPAGQTRAHLGLPTRQTASDVCACSIWQRGGC